MNNLSKTYPSVNCNAASLADLADGAPDQAAAIYANGQRGYYSVNNFLVPKDFIKRIEHELENMVFPYGEVIHINDIFDLHFLDTLDENESCVLSHVLLLLIEKGEFCLCFPDLTKAKA